MVVLMPVIPMPRVVIMAVSMGVSMRVSMSVSVSVSVPVMGLPQDQRAHEVDHQAEDRNHDGLLVVNGLRRDQPKRSAASW